MSLSSNTAQTRELTELRNHLKWLDEERRKSGRKMTELEQRLAQQGRDLAERDQKIQELEWHVANFSERFERMPDPGSNTAGIEQRLQDLEWHLSNMNTQLTRIPNVDEERARFQDEIGRAIVASQVQIESNQARLENRLQSEIAAIRSSDDLTLRIEEHAQAIRQLDQQFGEFDRQSRGFDQQFGTLQESVAILSAQLRERTNTLAAESQANYSSLAASMQEHLDAINAENRVRLDAIATENQVRLDAATAENQTRVDAFTVEWDAREARIDTLTAEWEARVHEMLATRSDMASPEILRIDAQIAQQYEELSGQLTAQRAASTERLEELEENLAKLGHVREIMPLLDRLEQELELRQAEEVRLSNLIGTQENRFAPLATSLEEITESNSNLLSRLADSERLIEGLRAHVQDVNENWKPQVSDLNRRIQPIAERATLLSNNIMRAEAGIQALADEQSGLREIVTNLSDDTERKQSEVNRQIEGWQVAMDENKDTIERFTQQWITLSNQYKEARMAVQNFAHWQKQLEQQKREASEMLRIESNRMQSRWDGFLMEIQEKLKNFELELNQKWQAFEIDNEQKWSVARRNEQVRHEEMGAIDELIQKLQQDNRNLIWRVQAAQADAIKKWPRLLMEEVEKAVEINPNRRLASTAAPRADMSVVDAIEQGLITIDYNDEPGIDL